jgi:hypothetical protein
MSQAALRPEEIVNLAAWPIADTADPRRAALVGRLRHDLDTLQYCVLPDFITRAALEQTVADVKSVFERGYRNRSHRTCYLYKKGDPSKPADDPANIFFDASYRMIANDVLPDGIPIKTLYRWPAMIRFVEDVVSAARLFPSDDPLQPVNVVCYDAGDCSAWHFDSTSPFTMTLMLQAAESGGEFEIVPNTRSQDDPMTAEVTKVLKGDRSRLKTVPREPGALVIFRGCNSLHRVTEVAGQRQRLMSVFVYEDHPGVIGDPGVNETVYGRSGAAQPA